MKKFLLIFMALSVMFMSGCGGSIYSDSDSDDSSGSGQQEEQEKKDTHNTQTVLSGDWVIMEGSGTAVNTESGTADILTLRMDHAVMKFSDVVLSGDVGTAMLYYSHEWHAFHPDESYYGDFDITSYRENDAFTTRPVRLTHVASDNWRVHDNGNEDNIIMITFDSASAMTTSWEGFSYWTKDKDYHYTLECTFRKE